MIGRDQQKDGNDKHRTTGSAILLRHHQPGRRGDTGGGRCAGFCSVCCDGCFPVIVTMEAFLRRFFRGFSPDEWMTRLLNLPKTKDTMTGPGLVMIQIDGLGFTQFERAIQKGNMPFLTRLIRREGYVNRRHYTGLPSNTPAVQGRLFYGVESCVPAFSFKDNRSGKLFNMFNPECAAVVENRLKDKGEPLLKDGSAYGNIFTGGAKEAHFCASSIGWGGLLKAANTLGVLLAVLLNFHIFIRALFLILVEFFLAIADSIRGIISGKNFLGEIRFIPLRVAVCILLREIVAVGARIDITRGLPVIHINLAGYDEQAHHRGPTSAFAHWSLRGIDGVIGKVWKTAEGSQRRHYDVFIYSDHGQEEALSYQEECGQSVEQAVNYVLENGILSGGRQVELSRGVPYRRADLLRNVSGKKKRPETKKEEIPLRAVVAAMGPVGHIYPSEALSLEEKEKIALQLIAKARIPITMISNGPGRALAWNSRGKFIFPDEAGEVLDTRHPFFKEVVRDLIELCHHPDSGELIILGWRKSAKPLTFHAEHGSHAGPGSEETSGFALLPMGALPQFFSNRGGSPSGEKETVCTQDLREAAFRAQGRESGTAGARPENAARAAGPPVLRIMTYNVHGCMGRDGRISPARIAGIIARYDPDIIALQELDTNESAQQARVIAQKLALTFHFYPLKGPRGNAIFSKYPMRLVKNAGLPKLPRVPFLEPRGASWVEVDRQGLKVQVFNTHLSLSPLEGLLQMEALCGSEWIGNSDCRGLVVLCGDLNALSRSKICRRLGQVLKNTHLELSGHRPLKTLPSFFPLGLVDHVFVGPGLDTTRIEVPQTERERMSSDHLPLIVDVRFG